MTSFKFKGIVLDLLYSDEDIECIKNNILYIVRNLIDDTNISNENQNDVFINIKNDLNKTIITGVPTSEIFKNIKDGILIQTLIDHKCFSDELNE